MKKLILITSLLVVSACSSIPQKLQLSEGTPLLNYANVLADKGDHSGEKVRWGGVIANVENQKERTMVEVLHFALSSQGRPIKSNETLGRFRVYFPGLLDPMIYKQGKSVTFTGDFSHIESGKIGEQAYQFPALNGQNVHLWKKRQTVDVRLVHDNYWSSYPYRNAFSPRYYHNPGFWTKRHVSSGNQKAKPNKARLTTQRKPVERKSSNE